ncbi:MAG TPA: tetratricopeptide repeat protein [Phycisphaerales bacterium]|nr:tetratricopeptide repeat protein [Phycisphaerales bacterium]HRQ76147.1 tetratricopeptide repeat protein [Phycisphaerales bacterium]
MADGRAKKDSPQGAPPTGAAPEVQNREGASTDAAAPENAVQPTWANIWQIPTILASLGLIIAAIVIATREKPANDFDGALAYVEQLILEGSLDEAGTVLREMIEPHIALAEPDQQALFQALVGDWISLAQDAARVDLRENNLLIDSHYAEATRLKLKFDGARNERWANALISMNRIDEARQKMSSLDVSGASAEMHQRYTRVFRRLVERALRYELLNRDELLTLLADYRSDDRTSFEARIWAAARQAEVRLAAGDPQRAVDHILVDMRRLESQATSQDATRPGAGDRSSQRGFGELYLLLGRGYFDLGDDRLAEQQLEQAVTLLEESQAVMSDAILMLGRIAAMRGDVDDALERFERVVREYPASPAELPALLGRAEVRSVMGDHAGSREDFAAVINHIMRRDARSQGGHPSAHGVASSLIDRHDASLAQGELRLAVEYVKLAERLFEPSRVPVDVLLRAATTSRQLAQNIISQIEITDREARHEANMLHQQAGEYFIRHARAMAGLPNEDGTWAKSLFDGADCFDQAGLHERAIRHFEEYLAGRSVNDPLRSEVNFRLGQCNQALMRFEAAAAHYERVLAEHPRSAEATRSHVPLARCYVAMGRRAEAERQLRQVVTGLQPLQPDAEDFRDALFELALLYYEGRNFLAAVATLDEAMQRYPEDARANDFRFRLADSYRSLAEEIAGRLRPGGLAAAESSSGDSPGERRRLDEQRREYLRRALELYQSVIAAYENRAERQPLRTVQEELLRSAYVHRGDCAYGLGMYDDAVHFYDQAARAYPDHHSSIYALIQIINCFVELGDEERARTAHRRALVRLRQLRDDAFDAPDALFDRSAWERWLEHSPAAPVRSASAAGG